MRTAGVLGAGAWGTALALVCARAGLDVTLWARKAEVAASINTGRENAAFLPGIRLEPAIFATTDAERLTRTDMVLAVAPAQFLRAALQPLAERLPAGVPVILCAKGIEARSLKLMTQVLAEVLPSALPAVLSGPSFADEVAKRLPTAVTLAAGEPGLAETLARRIASPTFRPYASGDLIGAEAGGAVKNVLAIGCGIIEGRGLGRSAHAALITRGFTEMTRLAVALGGEAETVAGLCGLGDLVLTCSSARSRNMSLGVALGRGESLKRILAERRSVAEGVASAPAVRDLAARLGVATPICDAVAAILAGTVDVDTAIAALLSRPLRSEGLA